MIQSDRQIFRYFRKKVSEEGKIDISQPVDIFPLFGKNGPLEHALYDIYRRVSERTNQFWLHRFVCSMQKYLKTNIWEAINLQEKTIPSFATYKAIRPFGGHILLLI
ncbi:MAG: hypothetical protein GY749_05820 [Desulfobacteraceae bacterium]|nr:hypothetical protein [Desulfobacteraceae bacterium]